MVFSSRFYNNNIQIDRVKSFSFDGREFCFDVARFDLIDPLISGNKLFKLYYQLLNVKAQNKKGILTMGGAYSNHLLATAALCYEQQIPSAAIIRGEESKDLSITLRDSRDLGMKLIFVSRNSYNNNDAVVRQITEQYPDYLFVPAGGDNEEGEKGASLIPDYIPHWSSYHHIFCAAGTGTTVRGVGQKLLPHQHLWIIPAVKIQEKDREDYFKYCLPPNNEMQKNISIHFDAAGKGFGKKEDELFKLMDEFFLKTHIPTDFVYTAKTLRGLLQITRDDTKLEKGSILMIHTGGIQGNRSLQEHTIVF
jgi:1-aminocyclopropane-1-carboxylate deaminase